MKRHIHSTLLFIFALVGTLNFSSLLHANPPSASHSQLPQEIVRCLPQMREQSSIAASVKEDGTTYYLVRTKFKESNYMAWGTFIVTAEDTGCVLLTPPEEAQTLFQQSLTQYLPKPVAQKLALSKWQKELAHYSSKEALRKELLAATQPGPDSLVLFPEDIWALDRLGISLP